jgi:hypothetical protein
VALFIYRDFNSFLIRLSIRCLYTEISTQFFFKALKTFWSTPLTLSYREIIQNNYSSMSINSICYVTVIKNVFISYILHFKIVARFIYGL